MDTGRIQAVVIATAAGNVVYERFYDAFSEVEKADVRGSFHEASSALLNKAQEEAEYVARYRCGTGTAHCLGTCPACAGLNKGL
jgi:hypothetical protein